MFAHLINGCFCYANIFENLKKLHYRVDQAEIRFAMTFPVTFNFTLIFYFQFPAEPPRMFKRQAMA